MKICFYSPYVPKHFGGGEKYFFEAALAFAKQYQVMVAISWKWGELNLERVRCKYEEFLGQDLSNLEFGRTPLGCPGLQVKKLWWTRRWGVLYFVTDGSAFFSLSQRTIMHVQVPLPLPPKRGLEYLKFRRLIINSNSYFTKKVVEKFWEVKVDAVCPPGVDWAGLALKPAKKEKIILSVGRFFANLHCKKQDVLVEFWRKLRAVEPKLGDGWRLVLLGQVEDLAYLERVQALAKGQAVEIITDAKREQVLDYYRRAKIYWHAAGYGEDEQRHPERMEHFGIATVEAMAAGCVPIVIGKGGQREILGQKLKDWAWQTEAECLGKTKKIMSKAKEAARVSELAKQRARDYDLEKFAKKQRQLLALR